MVPSWSDRSSRRSRKKTCIRCSSPHIGSRECWPAMPSRRLGTCRRIGTERQAAGARGAAELARQLAPLVARLSAGIRDFIVDKVGRKETVTGKDPRVARMTDDECQMRIRILFDSSVDPRDKGRLCGRRSSVPATASVESVATSTDELPADLGTRNAASTGRPSWGLTATASHRRPAS